MTTRKDTLRMPLIVTAICLAGGGLLAVAGVAGLCITVKALFKRGVPLREHAVVLCLVLWAAAWIVVFALPSQRSAPARCLS